MPTIHQRITEFNKDRLPDMVALKYKAMSASAFRFFRGTCHLFYEDLAAAATCLPASPLTWVCGDLHIENFGSYKADDHVVFFDLNDFDECALAPAAWELSRMVTSILVAFDSLGIAENKAGQMAQLFLNSYADTLAKGRALDIDPRTASGIVCTFLTAAEKRKPKQFVKKFTDVKKGHRRFIPDGNHFEIDRSLQTELAQHMEKWIKTADADHEYKVLDSIFRVAGTGSIGVKRYLFLLKSTGRKGKYLLIDMKQSLVSSLSPYLKAAQPEWASDAARIVAVQERMQHVSPALLGNTIFKNDPYVVQHLQPTADKINFELIKDRYEDIYNVINDMAILTASAQLRSSGRQGSAISDELIAFGQNRSWQQKVLQYAVAYVNTVKRDHAEFLAGYKKGEY